MVRGSPGMCMITSDDPRSDTVAVISGSDSPVTSFTTSAPASSATLATDALPVSIDTATPSSTRRATTGSTRLSSSAASTGLGAGTGRFAPDVHEVGALSPQFETAQHRDVGIGIEAAVGKGVGGDVEDPHDGHPSCHRRASVPPPAMAVESAIVLALAGLRSSPDESTPDTHRPPLSSEKASARG